VRPATSRARQGFVGRYGGSAGSGCNGNDVGWRIGKSPLNTSRLAIGRRSECEVERYRAAGSGHGGRQDQRIRLTEGRSA